VTHISLQIGLFLLGVFLLTFGAETVVKGSIVVSHYFKIPKIIIGLTVVAFATSAPELAVSLNAALSGSTDMAIGNIIGSCILNILLVLGLVSLITPIKPKKLNKSLLSKELPILCAVSALTIFIGFVSDFNKSTGFLFLGLLLLYIYAQKNFDKELKISHEVVSNKKLFINAFLTIFGITMLAIGSRWVVESSLYFARLFELSEAFIGLTVVAVGTSLPEIVTSIVANKRHEPDLAIGNIVGSNIFNLLFVLGLTSVLSPTPLVVSTQIKFFDMPIMLISVVIFWAMISKKSLSRYSGFLFLGLYVVYTAMLIAQK